jgi:hypothetical protein
MAAVYHSYYHLRVQVLFLCLDKETRGRKIVREFSKNLLCKQKVKGKQELFQGEGDRETSSLLVSSGISPLKILPFKM